jgi:thiol-disulfide isomerase/thioredoxin
MRALLPFVLLSACAGGSSASSAPVASTTTAPSPSPAAAAAAPAPTATELLIGATTREAIEASVPVWAEVRASTQVDATASAALARVPPGAEVIVVLGTWCGDSRREVPRLWRALEVAGEVPFTVRHIAVDLAKEAPGGVLEGLDVRYVPTFIVRRAGVEVGRIVEGAPEGLEVALGALLRGERSGVISLRGRS